jgi:hypothetical protein
MIKIKNTKPKPRGNEYVGIGVFLLIIVLIWFVSFRIAGKVEPGQRSSSDSPQEQGKLFGSGEQYPVMIMFDNHPDAQAYQIGLAEAAVVYEVLAEGGSTRFAAIYAGAPEGERIGPIRSARPYVVDIASGWSAFFWHAGGSPEALELLSLTDVIDLNEISGLGIRYFWRDNEVPRPHNLFTSSDLVTLGLEDFELDRLPAEKILWQWESKKRKPTADELDDLADATSIYVDFSEGEEFDASYEYTPATKTYNRFMGGIAHTDAATGSQIASANIIIQRTPEEGYYASGYGRIKINMVGKGEMLLFQKGKVVPGTWKKKNQDSQTKWFDSKGNPIVLVNGQTWVEVFPGDREIIY